MKNTTGNTFKAFMKWLMDQEDKSKYERTFDYSNKKCRVIA